MCSFVIAQLKTPNWKSTIHCQTAIATVTGVAHTQTSPTMSATRMYFPMRTSSSAISVEITIVRPTFTSVKTTVRRTMCQNSRLPRISR